MSVTLTFDATNWDQPQLVTVAGQDDTEFDGDIGYDLVTAPAVSADLDYDGLDASDVPAINFDDEGMVSVTGISPSGMTAGTTVTATISGSGFVAGATVSFDNIDGGPEPTASNVIVVSSTTITCSVQVGGGGKPGTSRCNVRVTNPDSSSGLLGGSFTVTKSNGGW